MRWLLNFIDDVLNGALEGSFPLALGRMSVSPAVEAEQARAKAIAKIRDARKRGDTRDQHTAETEARRLTTAALMEQVWR